MSGNDHLTAHDNVIALLSFLRECPELSLADVKHTDSLHIGVPNIVETWTSQLGSREVGRSTTI